MEKVIFGIFVISIVLYVADNFFHLGIFDKIEKILEK